MDAYKFETNNRIGRLVIGRGSNNGSGFRMVQIKSDIKSRVLADFRHAKHVWIKVTNYPGCSIEFSGCGRKFIRWAMDHLVMVTDDYVPPRKVHVIISLKRIEILKSKISPEQWRNLVRKYWYRLGCSSGNSPHPLTGLRYMPIR